MALKSAKDIDYKDQVISIRIQELDPTSMNARPDEVDLVDDGLCADSIGDIPSVGDYIGLNVLRVFKKKGSDEMVEERKPEMFKVLTRYFSLSSMIDSDYAMHCNIVVEPVLDQKELGRVIKD